MATRKTTTAGTAEPAKTTKTAAGATRKRAASKTPAAEKAAAPAKAAKAAKATQAPQAPLAAPAPAVITPEQRAHYIEVAAFYIAERRGFAAGDPMADWLAAQAEIDRAIATGRLGQG